MFIIWCILGLCSWGEVLRWYGLVGIGGWCLGLVVVGGIMEGRLGVGWWRFVGFED